MKAIILFTMLLFTGLYAQDDIRVYYTRGDTIDIPQFGGIYSDSLRIPPPDTVEVIILYSLVDWGNKMKTEAFTAFGYEIFPSWDFYFNPDSVLTTKYLTEEKKMIPHNWVIWKVIRKTEWENTWY